MGLFPLISVYKRLNHGYYSSLSLRLSRRGQRSSPVTKVIGTTSCPGIGVNLKLSTTESGGSLRECILCPTLVMVPPRTLGTCFLQASEKLWFTTSRSWKFL